jgi:hypothetical protein
MEKLMMDDDEGQQSLDLVSGEHLVLPRHLKIIFETDQLSTCSPAIVAKCALVSLGSNHLNWKVLFTCWFTKKTAVACSTSTGASAAAQEDVDETGATAVHADRASHFRWRQGQESLISGLFESIIPAIVDFFQKRCRPRLAVHATACFR